MIIGITGKSGSGKTYVASALAELLNATYIDIDEISHKVLLLPETESFILEHFGNQVYENNVINRKKIGEIIFNNNELLGKFNRFCTFQIEQMLDSILKNNYDNNIIFDYALLPGLKQFSNCDIKILIVTDKQIRATRVMTRENISLDYFNKRDASLPDYDESQFDIIVDGASETAISNIIRQIKERL